MADYTSYTQSVIDAIGENASPRIKKAFPIMIRKLHEAVIEADMTFPEWLQMCNLLVDAGKMSSVSSLFLCCRSHPPLSAKL